MLQAVLQPKRAQGWMRQFHIAIHEVAGVLSGACSLPTPCDTVDSRASLLDNSISSVSMNFILSKRKRDRILPCS